ncbi:hypothetical protein [Actinoplanes aureus]|uniref:Uncharacterized protein n=1 Tax=Actinoplanes aureus TaxID=2792083 RepID=A0A931CET7_9ACTN|nr:hypothetical protein [Actinoplanes aureus]MBG0564888.1 hypothetical protein [Actinoplanes aureus]MBG0569101.1 hypothetical protein [Actinoplanes aureus]
MLKLGEIEKVLGHGVPALATVAEVAGTSASTDSTTQAPRAAAGVQSSLANAATKAAPQHASQQVMGSAAVRAAMRPTAQKLLSMVMSSPALQAAIQPTVQSIMSSPAVQAAIRPAAQAVMTNPAVRAVAMRPAGLQHLTYVGKGKFFWNDVPPSMRAVLSASWPGKRKPTTRQVKRGRARLQRVRALVEKVRSLRQTHQVPAETATLAESLFDALTEALLRVAFTIRLQVTGTRPPSTIVHTTPRQARGPNTAGRVLTIGLRDGTRMRRGLPPFPGDPLVRREPVPVC